MNYPKDFSIWTAAECPYVMLRISVLVCLFFCVGPLPVAAERLEVLNVDSHEVKEKDLQPEEKASVVVHLMSMGQPVDKYVINLLRNSDSLLMMTLQTNVHGIVRFKGVPAGSYTIYCNGREGEEASKYVRIGDVVIEVSKSEDEDSAR